MADNVESRHYRFQKYEYYADRGMITLVDTEAAADSSKTAEEYTTRIPPGKFMKNALSALMTDPGLDAFHLFELKQLVERAAEVCKVAKAYGDPTDPSVRADVIRHQSRRQVVMPGELPPMPGMRYKIVARGETPAETLAKGADVVPDFNLDLTDKLTRKIAQEHAGG